MTKLIISMPMYNEEKNIGNVLSDIINVMKEIKIEYKILIIDDGSIDGSVKQIEMFPKAPIKIIKHKVNMGLGKTLTDLLKESCDECQDDDIIITMDSDNSHSPYLIKKILPKILDDYDLVIASRYADGGKEVGYPEYRTILSKIACTMLRLIFHIHGARDYTCGYRAYKTRILKKAIHRYGDNLIVSSGFAGMAEILIKINEIGIKCTEVPLVLRYDLKQSVSKLSLKKTILEYINLVWRNKLQVFK